MQTVELHFKHLGDGFPVIILHGLFGMLDNWMRVGKELADEYQVFLVDLRNHGRSPHTDTFGIEEMAADVRRLMDEQGMHESCLIGHSMGGKVAMRLTLDDPSRVKKLVIVDIATKAYDRKHDTIMDALVKLDPEAASSRDELDQALAQDIHEEAIRLFLLKNIKRNPESGYQWRSNLSGIVKEYDRILEEINGKPYPGPTCFIRGEKSAYILEEDKHTIRGIFPDARFVTIKGAGHWVHAEAPELFLENIREFLASDG